jgi:hypothetical protein
MIIIKIYNKLENFPGHGVYACSISTSRREVPRRV